MPRLLLTALVAALVAMSWLYVGERSRHYVADDNARTAALGGERVYQWKLVTTWPKNFPGLGTAPEKFAEVVNRMSRDMDVIEINEAFAAQVLACQQAFASDTYCREELGLSAAIGQIDPECLTVNGGAIALGHPIAASGARLALTLAEELRASERQFGLAALCVGGGQGQAMVLEAA